MHTFSSPASFLSMLPSHGLDLAINLLLLLICLILIEEAAVRECDIIIRFLVLTCIKMGLYGSLAVQMRSMQIKYGAKTDQEVSGALTICILWIITSGIKCQMANVSAFQHVAIISSSFGLSVKTS